MIGTNVIYGVAGLMFLAFALLSLSNRRHRKGRGNALMYGLLATSLLLGDRIGDVANGCIALCLVVLVGVRATGARDVAEEDEAEPPARRRDWRVVVPALLIPVASLTGAMLFPRWPQLFDPKHATLLALTLAVLLALGVAVVWFRPRMQVPFQEGRRLMDGLGWAALMPQMLASLGAVFALSGVGPIIGRLSQNVLPPASLSAAVTVYALGMALLTMALGNAFAAFPIMIAAIGVPVLIQQHGGNPAAIAAIGMLSGYCGTLMTPMAANFNLIPAALLGLRSRYAVIREQMPTAIALLLFNVTLLYWAAFR